MTQTEDAARVLDETLDILLRQLVVAGSSSAEALRHNADGAAIPALPVSLAVYIRNTIEGREALRALPRAADRALLEDFCRWVWESPHLIGGAWERREPVHIVEAFLLVREAKRRGITL